MIDLKEEVLDAAEEVSEKLTEAVALQTKAGEIIDELKSSCIKLASSVFKSEDLANSISELNRDLSISISELIKIESILRGNLNISKE